MAKQPTRKEMFTCSRCAADTDGFKGTKRMGERLCRDCFGKREDRRPRDLNDLTGGEWARASRSVEKYPDIRSPKQRLHGASFPASLAERQVETYTKRGGVVLDPFAGVGTTLDVCAKLGRHGIGIELNEAFAKEAEDDLALHPGGSDQRVLRGDAKEVLKTLPDSSCDMLLTSPPYADLLKGVKQAFAYKWKEHSRLASISNPRPYSEHSADLGNMNFTDFMDAVTNVAAESLRVLKSGAYAVWVLKDSRALKEGVPYVNLHGEFIQRAQAVGFTLWDIRIYDQTQFRPLVCLGYPSKNFYLNLGHSYLVVLRRP